MLDWESDNLNAVAKCSLPALHAGAYSALHALRLVQRGMQREMRLATKQRSSPH